MAGGSAELGGKEWQLERARVTGPFLFVGDASAGYTAWVHLSSVSLLAGAAAAWLAAGKSWFAPVLWLTLLLVCLALPPGERRLLDPRWLALGAALFAVSWVSALDREAAVGHGLTLLAAAVLFALARLAAPSDRGIEVMGVAIALTAVPALAQGAGSLVHLADSISALPPGMREAAAARLASGRAFGTAALPGHFAALQLLALPLLAAAAARHRRAAKCFFGLMAVLCCAGIAATRSLAVLGVAVVLLVVAAARRRGAVALAATGGLAIGVVAASTVLWRGDLGTLEPVRLRLINWQVAGTAFLQHPWLGVGLGGVGQAGLAGALGEQNITPYAHNTYLQLLAELGLAGGGMLGVGLLALIRLLARGLRDEPALTLAVLVLPVHNLVDFSAYAPEVVLPWAALLGTLAARCGKPARTATPTGVLLPLLCAGFVLSSLNFLAEERLRQAILEEQVAPALAAARLAPWSLTPVLIAAELASAPAGGGAEVGDVLEMLQRRASLRPVSASVAEARARLLLLLGCRGEAEIWAGEARRRAPWRQELAELEAACTLAP